jgi:hypothetical protein
MGRAYALAYPMIKATCASEPLILLKGILSRGLTPIRR